MAKYKVEYTNIEYDNKVNPYISQYVHLKKLGSKGCHDDLIASTNKHSDDDNSLSGCLNVGRYASVFFPSKSAKTDYDQDLITLHTMLMDLIKNEQRIVFAGLACHADDEPKELILSIEKEQAIDLIYQFVEEHKIKSIYSFAKEQRFFPHSRTQCVEPNQDVIVEMKL